MAACPAWRRTLDTFVPIDNGDCSRSDACYVVAVSDLPMLQGGGMRLEEKACVTPLVLVLPFKILLYHAGYVSIRCC